eukprot:Nitzschia sp. Nitz4//scaffold3_size479765//377012//378226//NITZ4_000159-RA/size479765-augustus-gene-1.621-mRNA-1//-1//CDS//3329550935//8038//frame0
MRDTATSRLNNRSLVYRRTQSGISVRCRTLLVGKSPQYDNMASCPTVDTVSPPQLEDRCDGGVDENNSKQSPSQRDIDSSISTDVQNFRQAVQVAWKEDPESLQGSKKNSTSSEEEFVSQMQELLSDTPQMERILIARKYQLEDSVALFFEQVRFRVRWQPKAITPKDIPNALPSGAWRLCGYTKEGYIISNYKLKHWHPEKYTSSGDDGTDKIETAVLEYTKYVVYMVEQMIANMNPELPQKFVVLFDLKGFSVSLAMRRDVRLMIRKLIYVAQGQYPERLHKTLLVNAPFGFEGAWRLIQPLLDEKTAAKIGFCSLKALTKEIDPSVLSKEYGGTHDEYPLPGH